jgi:uncharacterized membrane protein YfcA
LEWFDYFILFFFGGVGAFLSGFLGVGGGIIYVPVLDYFLYKLGYRNEELVRAILANSLFIIIFSGSISLYNQYKLKNIYPKLILFAAIPAAIGVVLTTWFITNGSWYSKVYFNYIFSAMLILVLFKMIKSHRAEVFKRVKLLPYHFSIAGFFTGIISALSGLGGGVILTPVLSDYFKLSIKKATSISNGVIPILAAAVGVFNLNQIPLNLVSDWQAGYIVFSLVIPMIALSPIFAKMGVKLAHRIQSGYVKTVFLLFVTIVLIKNLYEIIYSYF